MEKRQIIEYIREEGTVRKEDGKFLRGRPKGVLFAVAGDSETFMLGFSLCNKKDVFSKEIGKHAASARAIKWEKEIPYNRIPNIVADDLSRFAAKVAPVIGQMPPAWMVSVMGYENYENVKTERQ